MLNCMSKMRKLFFFLLLFSSSLFAEDNQDKKWHPFRPFFHRLHDVWTLGAVDVYVSGYAWHNRLAYDAERVKKYNENAWGGGFGKGLFDEKGNWRGIYAIAFLDSHNDLEPTVGYCYLKIANLSPNLKAGLGYSVLVTSRQDTFNGVPFPGVVPWASIIYKKAALSAAYIPGSFGAGNVLFLISRFTF